MITIRVCQKSREGRDFYSKPSDNDQINRISRSSTLTNQEYEQS